MAKKKEVSVKITSPRLPKAPAMPKTRAVPKGRVPTQPKKVSTAAMKEFNKKKPFGK